MTTYVLFTPALSSQSTAELSGTQSSLTSNAVNTPQLGATGLIGSNSNLGINTALNYINFEFQADFDGDTYNVIVTWSIYGERYYVTIFDTSNVRVLTIPLIGSPNDYDISLTAGYFTSTLVYRESSRQFEISP